jgi:hypothetical protein
LVVREHENDGVAAVAALEQERVERSPIIRRVGAQNVEQGPGKRQLINRIIERDSKKNAKEESGKR